MKILFLVKFYPPFDRGGSEWSTHDLAYLLSQKNHEVSILTPNYGTKKFQKTKEARIFRFPFLIKLKQNYHQPAPWWTNNLIWILLSTYYCFKYIVQNNIDIIHVHSNEFIPAAVIVGKLTHKPVIATLRDYQVICNLGFCLWHKNKGCSISQYFKDDVGFFFKNYSQSSNSLSKALIFLALLRAKIYQKILKYFAQKVDYKIAVSQKVREIFTANGFKNVHVINNPIITPKFVKVKRKNTIIYVGKLSKGKGVDLLFKSLPQVFPNITASQIEIVGSGHLLQILKAMAKTAGLTGKIKFVGQVNHEEVIKKISSSSLTVVPSVWPEPLPRAIIESILCQTPVVATNVGGNSEIIKNNFYGKICEPEKTRLARAIITAWEKRGKFKQNIIDDTKLLKDRYSKDVYESYRQIYNLSLQ